MISSPAFSNPNSTAGFRTKNTPVTRHTVTCIAATAAPAHKSSTLYDVLGINSGASFHDIKVAYRRLVRECHPDIVGDDQKADSANEFIRIHAAYATLSDPNKRADYDRDMMMSIAGSYRWGPNRRPVYRRKPRTWETDQCW